MKKILLGVALLFFGLALVGCSERTTAPTTAATAPVYTDTFTTKEVEFINFSTEFIKEEPVEDITLYYFTEKAGIPYVDISEFVTMLLGIIDETIVVENNGESIRVWLEYFYTEEEKEEYGLVEDSMIAEVNFDFTTTTVTAPDINTFDYFTGETETDFSEGLDLVNYTEEALPGFSVNLADYGFRFYHVMEASTDKHLIPLSLAGLFLTGSMFDVVNNGDYLYGIDTYQLGDVTDVTKPIYDAVRENKDATPEMILESQKFLEFTFDYFYGLKAYKSITAFGPYLSNYFTSGKSFEQAYSEFTDSFADLHTGIISYGHQNPSFDSGVTPQFIYDYSYEYYGCECNFARTNFKTTFYEDMAYIQVIEFTTDFKAELEAAMADVIEENPNIIVFDLACNGGGVLAGVFHLLNYMTNDHISFYTTTLGAKSSSTYNVEGDKALDVDFYIITSGATYSAANLFTALAKEMNLAKTIGSKSGGGACSVKALVLPNGAIMQMSSNMNLTYSDYLTVEEGVDPDYEMDFYTKGYNYYTYGRQPRYPDPDDFYLIIQEMENPAAE
ncbi:MAG: S41 family peptidase [Candidatus Izemoplasmatales bacterium]|jgi:hypothetical protein|nr:S41 family peptidase [Candidatus Izemoplasmatales bacterium]